MNEGRETVLDARDGACPLDAEVSAAIERLTNRPPFDKSPRLSEFLTYIVDEALAGRGNKISGYTVGVDVYGKPETFDPSVDTVVRVEARRLRRSLVDYYREAGADDPVEIVVPKGTYVPEFRYRTSDRMITAVVSSNVPQQSERPDRGPSIAVLPFQNYSTDSADQYFADGLTEETIANLARFKDLFVYSRSTTSKMVHDGANIRQLHEELDVEFVLEGSVRKTPQAVRVTVQLIDAATDGHVLAEQFDRACTPEGVFEIQDEIAQLVAGRVADRHGPLGRYIKRARRAGQTQRWETYYWISRFYGYYATHDPEKHLQVREGLTEALENDPTSSDGWAALSIILLDEYRLHLNERASYPVLDHALEHALSAVVQDPENAFAHQALALAHFHRREFTDFRVSGERAVALNPGHADVLVDIGHAFGLLGDYARGLPMIHRAIALSPVHPGWYHFTPAWYLALNGKAKDAVFELKQAPMPDFYWYRGLLAWFHAEAGNIEEAKNEVNALVELVPSIANLFRGELDIWCAHDALTQAFMDGLRKAGLEIA